MPKRDFKGTSKLVRYIASFRYFYSVRSPNKGRKNCLKLNLKIPLFELSTVLETTEFRDISPDFIVR